MKKKNPKTPKTKKPTVAELTEQLAAAHSRITDLEKLWNESENTVEELNATLTNERAASRVLGERIRELTIIQGQLQEDLGSAMMLGRRIAKAATLSWWQQYFTAGANELEAALVACQQAGWLK
jgi:uncharacterized coiled-coil protein SlyX